jgi:hypothetical protein
MQWTPCPEHHDLKPIVGWRGRYRCEICGVVCYRREETGYGGRRWVSYKCPQCGGPTTGRGHLCPQCKRESGR